MSILVTSIVQYSVVEGVKINTNIDIEFVIVMTWRPP